MCAAMESAKSSDSEADAGSNNHPTTLLSNASSYAHASLDSMISPSSRQRAYDATSSFASNQPILFSFTAFQVIFSLLPLLLFLAFALSTFLLALSAAFAFTLFWIGIACLFLIPTLFITSSLAVLCWGTSVGSFVLAKRLYHHAPAGLYSSSSDASTPIIKVTLDGVEETASKDVQVKQEDHFDDVKSLE